MHYWRMASRISEIRRAWLGNPEKKPRTIK